MKMHLNRHKLIKELLTALKYSISINDMEYTVKKCFLSPKF